MNRTANTTSRAARLSARAGATIVVLLCLGLLSAAPAMAGFEQVANFAESGEGQGRLGATTGLAVNYTGAGGVPAGTLYGVRTGGGAIGDTEVTRWSPTGEFREAWGWKVSAGGSGQFERCGPDGEPAHPTCNALSGSAGEGAGQLRSPQAVAVDQSTGYVYVLSEGGNGGGSGEGREHNLVEVFSADGSQLIDEFGDWGTGGIEAEPEKLHMQAEGGLAVDASGDLYVSDSSTVGGHVESRIMLWKPQSPGDYKHYGYAGRARDIPGAGRDLAVDDAGNLYRIGSGKLQEIGPGETSPKCEYDPGDGGLLSIAVDPASGEVFYFHSRPPKVVYQLSACNAQGTFAQVGELVPTPTLEVSFHLITALAFNPSFAWGGTHPPGVLYGADNFGGLGYIFAPAEAFPPVIVSESASAVTATAATLGAQVDPRGSITRYFFQYETAVAYEANDPGERFAGAVTAPLGGATLPAVKGARAAAASVSGLVPDTEYRYRVIAESRCEPSHPEEACRVLGEAQRLRTFAAGAVGLPDGRAWELVSPVEKKGGEVFPLHPQMGSGADCLLNYCKPGINLSSAPSLSSPGGGGVVYQGFRFSESEGAAVANEYLSRRTATGWQTTILAPAKMTGSYDGFDTQLGRGILLQEGSSLTPSAPSEYGNLYAQPTSDPLSLAPLVESPPPDREPGSFKVDYAGASADLSHLFFDANDALTGETPFAPAASDPGAGKHDLYESLGGQLRLVNVLPGNAASAVGAVFGRRGGGDLPHAISKGGSVAFWSDEAGQLYARIDGERTVEIHDPGVYLTASADGGRVLLSDGCLYDLNGESCTDLSEGKGGFTGIAGASEDLSHVYFVDSDALTGEVENEYGAKAQEGEANLYAWHEGVTSFVATLGGIEGGSESNDWNSIPIRRTAESSPHGRWLAFLSADSLTGYDNVGPACSSNGSNAYVSGPCTEAFLYDSVTSRLVCVSCNPSGARPLGPTTLPVTGDTGGEAYLPQAAYLTDSGRLYFDSRDALSPLDTNRAVEGPALHGEPSGAGAASAEDVYQYESTGVGSCTREGGCVALLSGGRGSQDSNFLAVDETGRNVFFTTRDQLVPQDHDELMDLYDAREGGGFPPMERGVECQGEACQPPVSPPSDLILGSLAFEGAGNLVSPPPTPAVVLSKPKAKGLTQSQKLVKALRVCRRESRKKRHVCERTARARYGHNAKQAVHNQKRGK
jgi:hypothetical protein